MLSKLVSFFAYFLSLIISSERSCLKSCALFTIRFFFKIEIDVLEVKLRIICVHQKSIDEFTDIDYCDCDCNAAPIC